jgi:hypothetical protein
MMTIRLLDPMQLPKEFSYPESFLKVIRLNLIELDPWYIMDNDEVKIRMKGLSIRYPDRNLIPFARRRDNDDVACFELNKGEKVQMIHDFASSGYEQRKAYESFWDWFKESVETMIQFD